MKKSIKISELPEFDPADFLRDELTISEYLACIAECGDADLLASALCDVSRARMATGTARESDGSNQDPAEKRNKRSTSHKAT